MWCGLVSGVVCCGVLRFCYLLLGLRRKAVVLKAKFVP